MEENIEKNESANGSENASSDVANESGKVLAEASSDAEGSGAGAPPRHRRQEKIGLVTSDKMQKTVVVRVERQVRHRKYKRYIRRRTKFMAHDEVGAHTGDIVRIVETRPLSARKRWRVVEIVQKAR
ncbi:MAG TPA: 30S ribosomal protein S17 [Blastocatellia bacterium]|nr:30S ribosomal protein S17 [Blastocatellia bacterium]